MNRSLSSTALRRQGLGAAVLSIAAFTPAAGSLAILLFGCTSAINLDGDDDDLGTGDPCPPDVSSAAPQFVFAVIGDYGDDDDDTREAAELIRSWDPDLIITTGDNDYSDGAYKGTFEGLELAVGQYFHEFVGDYQGSEGSGASDNRFFPTPGDHDWGDTCDDPSGLDDYLRYFTLPDASSGNERYYDFRRGPVHFFSIHSLADCEPDGATPTSLQGQWVRATAAASDAVFKVAYFHNPPYSSGDRHVGEGAHMRWPWNEWGFDLVLSGDDHVYERIERDGVTYVVNGLGGVDRHDFVDEPVSGSRVRFNDAHGAMRVEVFEDRMSIAFLTVEGTIVDEFCVQTGGSAAPTEPLDPNVLPITEGDWYRPAVATTWQWQLQPNAADEINTGYAVDVYDIDLFDAPDAVIDELHAAGRKVLCYFSAGSYEDFRDDAGQFLSADLGDTLDGFADERWLDVRSSNVRRIMLDRLDFAAQRGCDGVEPDNVDGFANNSGFPLTPADQLTYNRFLANEAHRRNLSVGLKNDLDQVAELVQYFDFAVNEQCHEYDECDLLQPFIASGKPVFNAEYQDRFVNNSAARADLCSSSREQDLRTLVLPLDLDDSFRFSCDP